MISKTKVLSSAILIVVGFAFIETGQLNDLSRRFLRPPAQTAKRQVEVLEETADYRLIKHPLGETKVPIRPHRIVSLTNSATDSLCALGIKPILVATSWRSDSITPYLREQLEEIPKLRYGEAVDVEALLRVNPDLIFAGVSRDGRLYKQLSKIAPTVCIASSTMADRELRLLDVGETIGMIEAARQRLDAYYQRVASARRVLKRQSQGRPVGFLRFRRNTCVIYTRTLMFGPLLFDQLGLEPDPEMPIVMTGGGWDVLSVERLSTLQSEYLFVVVDRDSEFYFNRVRKTPIWENIPAVAHEHVFFVAAGTWLSGDGVLGCEAIIDDVLQCVVSN
ncbi:MAG: ferrichrome ABC transporter substrate-binding protein [Pirellulaceae bacterium]|nr:MAG: ferrichrome ABC transporter substrate-binding protein [Pirellulaceae bacterium]